LQQEQEAEEISVEMLHYYDNKPTVDELMAKPEGLFHLLDEASKTIQGSDFILGGFRKNSVSISTVFQLLFISTNV
jgi:myosin heavy subunit